MNSVESIVRRNKRIANEERNRKLGIPPGVPHETFQFLVFATQHNAHEILDQRTRDIMARYYGTETHASDLIPVANVKTRVGVLRIIKTGLEKVWDYLDETVPNLAEKFPKDAVIKMKDNHTPVAIKRAGDAQIGKDIPLHVRLKFSRAKVGTTQSAEVTDKKRAAMLRRLADTEFKEKRTQAIIQGRQKKRSPEEKTWNTARTHHLLYRMVEKGTLTGEELSVLRDFFEANGDVVPSNKLLKKFEQATAKLR